MNYLKSSKNNYHFTKKQLNKKLIQLGLKKNDIVFSHSNLAFFGKIKEKGNICNQHISDINIFVSIENDSNFTRKGLDLK